MAKHSFSNKQISEMLKEVLAALEVKETNFFITRAYQNVISVIESLSISVYNLWEQNKLDQIPGIGAKIKSQLIELFSTGDVAEFHSIKEGLPEGMFELIGIRGIGAKKAFKLANAFNLTSRKNAREKLKKAAEAGMIRNLDGFAEKSEKLILEALSENKMTKNEQKRTLLFRAEQVAERVADYLKRSKVIEKFELVGSFRRRKSTVGDIEFAIASNHPEKATEYFLEYPEIEEVLVSGKTRSSVVINGDLQVDVRVFEPKVWGSMLQYFTGSKLHNIILRTYALEKGFSLSEYGIKEIKSKKVHEFETEEGFYNFLGLDYIPPEIREGKNEVELAEKKKLPHLASLSDIKGDLHTHTNFSDGVNTLEEMVEAGIALGYEYIGITDHAPSVQSRGQKEVEKIIFSTRKRIDKLNKSQSKIKVYYGYEVNILADANMSLPDDFLELLDYAIGSIHTSYNQSKTEITKRMIAALENPYIRFLGHPSGRLINEREAYEVEWRDVFSACIDNGKFLEINSQPNRLDLPDDIVYEGLSRGVKFVINTDAHQVDHLLYMKYGVDVARRGWCTKADIVNTGGFPF